MHASSIKARQLDEVEGAMNFRTEALGRGALPDGRASDPAAAPSAQTERHVFEHVQMREERVVLKHHPKAAVLCRKIRDLAAVEFDCARIRRFQTRDHSQGRGLATAGGPEQAEELAAFYGN